MTLSSVILDLIAVIVLASLVVGGYKKGFLKTIVLAAGTLASLLIAFWLSGWLADLIFSNIIRECVIKNIRDTLSGLSDATSTAGAIPAVLAALPAFVLNPMMAQYGSKEEMIAEIQRNAGNTLSGLSETITDTVVSPVLTMLLRMLLCLLIFIICVIIIKIVAKALGAVRRIPLVGTLNAVLGAVVGAVQGLIALFLLGLAGNILVSLSGNALGWFNTGIIGKSYIYQFFYQFF